ncbi:RcnB family protein [Sphingomonas sp. YL-JM2C]
MKHPDSNGLHVPAAIWAVLMVGAVALPSSEAAAQYAHGAAAPANRGRAADQVRVTRVTVDRGRPGWWRGHAAFASYAGPRAGYFFAPGYGYHPVPAGYAAAAFRAGATLPPPMRSYVVVTPAAFGLAPPPPSYSWFFVGSNIVLASPATGVIVRSVPGGW